MVDELWLADPGGRDQQTDREGPTDDGRHLGEPPGAVRVGPVAPSTARIVGVSAACLPSGRPGSKHFDDEEWVALGLRPESCRQFRIDRVRIA